MANTTKATQRSKAAETATNTSAAIEAVAANLSPDEDTLLKRRAGLEKARATLAQKRLHAKRVAAAAKARKAKATKAKLRINAEKARAAKARLAEFEVSKVAKNDLVAFIETTGLRKELLKFLDEQAEKAA